MGSLTWMTGSSLRRALVGLTVGDIMSVLNSYPVTQLPMLAVDKGVCEVAGQFHRVWVLKPSPVYTI